MITCYPIATKRKSVDICCAFAEGCEGQVVMRAARLVDGPCFFYGVDTTTDHLWRQAVMDLRRDYIYSDNAYFDVSRQTSFRITFNRLQHSGRDAQSDGKRFAALGITLAPWRTSGDHIVVCAQSDYFMRAIAGYDGDWLEDTIKALKRLTKRPLVIRSWLRDKGAQVGTLQDALVGAHAVVTWSSSAAITAVLSGIPIVAMGQSAAAPMSGPLDHIEKLPMPDHRDRWAARLADNQFTLAEMRSGYAWQTLTTH